jgi:shikimate dehydrogenase
LGQRVVLLGAGGAARGVAAGLMKSGGKKFVLVNRTRAHAEKLANDLILDAEIYAWDKRHAVLEGATLLVNCTSLGMAGQAPLDLDLSALPKTAAVCDIVYKPLETPLLSAARARGNPAADGLGMLLHQGRVGFKLWFGLDPEVSEDLKLYMKGLLA